MNESDAVNIRHKLETTLRLHGASDDQLLDALHWKFRKIWTEKEMLVRERDQAKAALGNAMTMLDGSHRTIERLMAENARLTELLAEAEPLEAENDHLRAALVSIDTDMRIDPWVRRIASEALAKEAGE